MLSVVGYFGLMYAIIVASWVGGRWIARRQQWAAPGERIPLMACALFLLFPFWPYARVTAQTVWHEKELRPAVQQSLVKADTDGTPIANFRVLTVTHRFARVYVVQTDTGGPRSASNPGIGTVFVLSRTGTDWKYNYHRNVWSDGGNAEGNVFPPYPEGM